MDQSVDCFIKVIALLEYLSIFYLAEVHSKYFYITASIQVCSNYFEIIFTAYYSQNHSGIIDILYTS